MSKRTRASRIEGQFAARLVEMIRSPAFCVLSLSARRVLDRLEIELADHGGQDNGSLPVTFEDFVHFGLDRHSIAPAIRELESLGFVEVTQRGRAGNALYRRPNLFRLTYRHMGRANGTHEWRKIKDDVAAVSTAREAREKAKAPLGYSKGPTHKTSADL